MADKSLIRLQREFDHLQRGIPNWGSRPIGWLRRPGAIFLRLPIGLLLIVGGFFSFLPILGLWMLPLGLLFLALDIPFLRKPVALSSVLLRRRFSLMGRKVRNRKRERRMS